MELNESGTDRLATPSSSDSGLDAEVTHAAGPARNTASVEGQVLQESHQQLAKRCHVQKMEHQPLAAAANMMARMH